MKKVAKAKSAMALPEKVTLPPDPKVRAKPTAIANIKIIEIKELINLFL